MMKRTLIKSLACAGIALGIILGCNTGVDNGGTDSGGGGSDGGFANVESYFSDAPVSPGGTGGTDGGGGGSGSDDQTPIDLPSEETRSFFTAFQVDPVEEDSAGPKFVVSGDVDQDGLLDMVSAWNQSQPIQLHLQRRDTAGNISFRSITLGGTTPFAVMAGVELGQINGDGFLDVVVLVKATGLATFCPTCQGGAEPSALGGLDGQIIVLFNPGDPVFIPDGDRWTEMALVNLLVSERNTSGHEHFPGNPAAGFEEAKTKPEIGGFTALVVADIDGRSGDDIVVALNPATCATFGQQPPLNTVDLWINPGPTLATNPLNWVNPAVNPNIDDGAPITLLYDLPQVKDVVVYDVDGDTDLDVVATFTNAQSRNVRWARNPLIEVGPPAVASMTTDGDVDRCVGGFFDGAPCPNGNDDCLGLLGTADDGCCTPTTWHFLADQWEKRPIGQIDSAADILAVGDADTDGFQDVVVRSTAGGIIQWFRRPNSLTLPPEFPPNDPLPDREDFPWTVYTITEFTDQELQAIALGDVTGDGQPELIAAVGGGVLWFDATVGATVYDPWFGNTIIQDSPDAEAGTSQQDPSSDTATDPDAVPETTTPGGTGVGVNVVDASTYINSLIVVDLDGDGKNDVIGTLDRRTGSGLSDDRLVWYRNTRTDDPAPAP